MNRVKYFTAMAALVLVSLFAGCKDKPTPEPDESLPGQDGKTSSSTPALAGTPAPADLARTASMFPAGALIFLYTPDFSSLVEDFLASEPVAAFLQSDGRDKFEESRLYLKLAVRYRELKRLIDPELPPEKLKPLAGSESGFALYDISEIKFVYITRIPSAILAETALWAARGQGLESSAAGYSYFTIASPSGSSRLIFGMAGDFLVMGNEPALFADAFSRAAGGGKAGGGLAEDAMLKEGFPADFKVHRLAMAIDQKAMNQDPYFRRYWVHQNFEDIDWINSVAVDLDLDRSSWRETRYYTGHLPAEWTQSRDFEPCFAAVSAGTFAECMAADADRAARRILAVLPVRAPDDAPEPLAALRALIAAAEPVYIGTALRVDWSDDGVFFKTARAIVVGLHEPGDLDRDELADLVASIMSSGIVAGGGPSLEWKNEGETMTLSLPLFSGQSLYLTVRGDMIVFSNDGALHSEVLDQGGRKAPAGLSGLYYSRLDAERARRDFLAINDVLTGYSDWPLADSRETAQYRFSGLAGAVTVKEIVRSVIMEQNMVKETVTAGTGKPR